MNIQKIGEAQYPPALQKMPFSQKPKQLYFVGNVKQLYEPCLGIVGTRHPTNYGMEMCTRFAKEMALREITIISGMAKGIDSVAHQTALHYHTKTIAVLGCGLLAITAEEKEMVRQIVEAEGLVISAYEPDMPCKSAHFLERNAILASLAEGILVIEAAYRSGSSLTARLAMEYDKSVFAIPGRIGDKKSVGTNRLIQKGAILSTKIEDILERYPQFVNKKRKTDIITEGNCLQNFENIHFSNFSGEEQAILKILRKGASSLESICLQTQIASKKVLEIITFMELQGMIIREKEGKYRANI